MPMTRLDRPRIGLYFDLRNPDEARPWHDLYRGTLERIAEAERRGLEAVWVSEHHGFEDGYVPQPLVFCAAVAACTSTVRIGTAIAIAPLAHPVALAEQAAMVDIISGGRLELGLGAGYRRDEFEIFGADHAQRYERLEQVAGVLGETWSTRRATPAPIQQPLPMWIGARGPRGAGIAGRLGAGLLWIGSELVEPYLDGLAAGGHDQAEAKMGGLVNVLLADDPEAAMAEVRAHGRRNRDSYHAGGEAARGAPMPRLEVATPADAARSTARSIVELPVTDIFCFERIGGVDGRLVERHVELLTGEFPELLSAELSLARGSLID